MAELKLGKIITKWLSGSSDPASTIGTEGDYYLNTLTGDVFKKGAAAWTKEGNIKGVTGATGAQGNVGATGSQGPKGDKGDVGAIFSLSGGVLTITTS